jgi:AraC-like DNA-binding protein
MVATLGAPRRTRAPTGPTVRGEPPATVDHSGRLRDDPHYRSSVAGVGSEWRAAPSAGLSHVVWCYRSLALPAAADGAAPQIVRPRGSGLLVLDCSRAAASPAGADGRTVPRVSVVGPRLTLLTTDIPPEADLLVVAFRPAGLRAVTDVPLHELQDDWVDAADVLDRRLAAGLARVTEQPPLRRLPTLERVLGRALGRSAFDPAVTEWLKRLRATDGAGRLGDLGRDLGVGDRQLRRIFRREVGVGPKQLLRLARFGRLCDLALTRPAHPAAGLAHTLGYADQSHLIEETRALTGRSFEAFRRLLLRLEEAERARLVRAPRGMSDVSNQEDSTAAMLAP